ncbi:hypothetical protein Trco_004958 [Trichoderma cornu-damae]|uniref:Uncharacterized protein n=1 Tax=Trichoderma cornu-damae TaxID=654480 RepID=A0A9P8QM82_9HYPO|nr:hypothetical protein Trco_004958 [Trichoderma cornu-damae]
MHVRHQVGNGADLEAPFPGKGDAGLTTQHARAVAHGLAGDFLAVVDNLADDSRLSLAGKAAELGGGLGMAVPGTDTAGGGAQRQDMAGPAEAGGRGGGVGEDAACEGAVVGADAGGDGGVGGVDGDCVGGAARILAVLDHGRQFEGIGAGVGDGRADEARRVAHHPGHLLGGDGVGGDDEVGFVLTGRVVEHDEELASACRGGWGGSKNDLRKASMESGMESN